MTAWLPSDAGTALALWIDPSDAATVTTSGGKITFITDKSGNGRDFGTIGSGLSPTTQNGLTALTGDAAGSNALAQSNGLTGITNAANTYACAAGITGSPATTNAAFTAFDGTGRVYAWLYDGASSVLRYRHGSTTNSGITGATSAITVQTHSGTSLLAYANGTADLTASNAANYTSALLAHQIGGNNNASWGFPGWIGDCIIYSGVLSQGDREKLEGYLAHKWGLNGSLPSGHPYKSAPPTTGNSYTLTASAGSFGMTGATANLLAGRKIDAAAGSFTLASPDIFILKGLTAGGAQGSFALSGGDAGLARALVLTASAPAYSLASPDAALTYARTITASTGAFTLTGADASTIAGLTLAAANGAFALSGAAAAMTSQRTIDAAAGAFTLTPATSELLRGLAHTASAAAFALTGADAALAKSSSYSFSADVGAFTLAANDAGLKRDARIDAAAGAFTVAAPATAIYQGRTLVAGVGAFTATFGDAILTHAYALAVDSGQFAWAGSDASFTSNRTAQTHPLAGIPQPYPRTGTETYPRAAQTYPLAGAA